MSIKVKARLDRLQIETTYAERSMIDMLIERRTGVYCDVGVSSLSDAAFKEIVEEARRKRRRIVEG